MSNRDARYCPQGHYLERIRTVRRDDSGRKTITCDGCGRDIQDEFIAGSCQGCDMDFCEACFQSGRSIENMLLQQRQRQPQRQVVEACCMLAIVQTADPVTAAARSGERYNRRRPNYLGLRVDSANYPDPTHFGWTFTGSCEGGRAEFFEKDFAQHGVVKLDFYYTTGTVKTVLDHPRQGVTQLFGKGADLSPELYRAILENPRVHTDVRYHRRI